MKLEKKSIELYSKFLSIKLDNKDLKFFKIDSKEKMQIKNLFRKNFFKSYLDFFSTDFMNTSNKRNPEKFNQEIKNKIFLLSYMYEADEKQIDSKIISYIKKY